MRKLSSSLMAAMLLFAWGTAPARAADKPITIIVPFSAGSGTDVTAREFAQELSAVLKQPVVVDNRVGAEGRIAAQALINAAADGHTLIFTSSSLSVLDPLMKKDLPYDPVRDFAPVCSVARMPVVLSVPGSSAYKSAAEVVDAAKAKPGILTFAHSSASLRLAGELFNQSAGIKMTDVPYKSTVTALTDLAGSQVDTMHIDISGGLPFFQSGRLRPLLVTGSQRINSIPEVPSAVEAGIPGYSMSPWFGVFASSKVSRAVVEQMRLSAAQALTSPSISANLTKRGLEPFGLCGEELRKFQQEEIAQYRKVLAKAGIEPQ